MYIQVYCNILCIINKTYIFNKDCVPIFCAVTLNKKKNLFSKVDDLPPSAVDCWLFMANFV